MYILKDSPYEGTEALHNISVTMQIRFVYKFSFSV